MFELEISRLEEQLKRKQSLLPSWKGYRYGKHLKMNIDSLKKEIQSYKDREKRYSRKPRHLGRIIQMFYHK